MSSKLWRVPFISIATGIVSSLISSKYAYFMAKGTSEWTVNMGTTTFWIDTIVSIVLFIGTGLVCFKDMTKQEITKSALIVSTYFLIVLILEQFFQANGLYPTVLLLLFVPVHVYSVLHSVLLHNTSLNGYLLVAPSILMPFLYIFFGREENTKLNESLPNEHNLG